MFDQSAQAVSVRDDQYPPSFSNGRGDEVLPAWPETVGRVSEAFAAGPLIGAQPAIAPVAGWMPRIRCIKRRWRSLITSAPGFDLVFPVLLLCTLLIETL